MSSHEPSPEVLAERSRVNGIWLKLGQLASKCSLSAAAAQRAIRRGDPVSEFRPPYTKEGGRLVAIGK